MSRGSLTEQRPRLELRRAGSRWVFLGVAKVTQHCIPDVLPKRVEDIPLSEYRLSQYTCGIAPFGIILNNKTRVQYWHPPHIISTNSMRSRHPPGKRFQPLVTGVGSYSRESNSCSVPLESFGQGFPEIFRGKRLLLLRTALRRLWRRSWRGFRLRTRRGLLTSGGRLVRVGLH